jgi:hypothetical protein
MTKSQNISQVGFATLQKYSADVLANERTNCVRNVSTILRQPTVEFKLGFSAFSATAVRLDYASASRRTRWPSMARRQALSRLAFGPHLRWLTALTGHAVRPSFATKSSMVRYG